MPEADAPPKRRFAAGTLAVAAFACAFVTVATVLALHAFNPPSDPSSSAWVWLFPGVSLGLRACAPGVAFADTARKRALRTRVKAAAIGGFVLTLVLLLPAAVAALFFGGVWLLLVLDSLEG